MQGTYLLYLVFLPYRMRILKWKEKCAESLHLKKGILLWAKCTSHVTLNLSAFHPALKYLLNWGKLRKTWDLPKCLLQRSGELNQNSCSWKLVFKLFCERSALSVLITQSSVTAAGHRHYVNIRSQTAYLVQEYRQGTQPWRCYSHML